MASLLTEQDLDDIEKRYIAGCKGTLELSASYLEELRRMLVDNKRLVVSVEHDGQSEYLADEDNLVPFPAKITMQLTC